jgi:hypothetical protein
VGSHRLPTVGTSATRRVSSFEYGRRSLPARSYVSASARNGRLDTARRAPECVHDGAVGDNEVHNGNVKREDAIHERVGGLAIVKTVGDKAEVAGVRGSEEAGNACEQAEDGARGRKQARRTRAPPLLELAILSVLSIPGPMSVDDTHTPCSSWSVSCPHSPHLDGFPRWLLSVSPPARPSR